MKKYPRSSQYDSSLVGALSMGPNPLFLLEEVCEHLDIQPNMRILDLGCGMGLTSIFLAKEYGAIVYAADLWIPAAENYQRVIQFGLENQVIPLNVDSASMPFAEEYFDVVIAIDSYQYFGLDEGFFPKVLSKLIKPRGQFGLAVPGFTREIREFPVSFSGLMDPKNMRYFHAADWWKALIGKSETVTVKTCYEIEDAKEIWYHWARIARERLNFNDDEILDADKDNLLTLMVLTAEKG